MLNENPIVKPIVKRDDEKVMTMVGCGFFSGALLIVLLTAGNLFHMGFGLSVLAFATVGACAYSWYQLLKNFQDPNKDYWRLLCILFAIAAICVIMGQRGAWLGSKAFNQDVEKAKVESLYTDTNHLPSKIPQP